MKAILDTNVFVGAGFNPRSASAKLIHAASTGAIILVWDAATQDETRRILTRIPRLSWEAAADAFLPENEWTGGTDLAAAAFVEDPEDRKFAALSLATRATLVSSDSDLLDHRDLLDVMPPTEILRALQSQGTSTPTQPEAERNGRTGKMPEP